MSVRKGRDRTLTGAPLLALDGSTRTGSVAVGLAGEVWGEVTLGPATEHGAQLLPAVDYLLRLVGAEPRGLAGVVVGGGPGSFTGLRIAAATAKSIAHAVGVPLFAFGSLEAEAAAAGVTDGEVCALFDARRDDVFAARVRFRSGAGPRSEPLWGPEALPIGEVLARVAGPPTPLLVGEGAWAHRERIADALGCAVPEPGRSASRAAALLWLADVDPGRGRVARTGEWQPEYVRASGAERAVGGVPAAGA